ncbi:hypothetical protein ACFX2J_014008 [Malus domestica]
MTSEEIEIHSGVEAATPINGGAEETVTPAAFRCKKCRRVVASQDNVLDHKPGEGEQSWRRKTKSGGGDGGSSKSVEEGSKILFVDFCGRASNVDEDGGRRRCSGGEVVLRTL